MASINPADFGFDKRVPKGDDRQRHVCRDCGWVHYVNPKIVVGSVAVWQDRFLLCRRAIEPRSGFWTLPAGYMEERETTEDAARREAQEEARADIEIEALLAVYSIPRISQVQLIYKARLRSPDVSSGPESVEVALFRWAEIPWDELAFPSVRWALEQHQLVAGKTGFQPFGNPAGELGDLRRDGL
ncbi:NUDIX hydrolase [Oceanibacterium hippocampi]|uniref:NUDIX hydrolase n=1 Tax=Oceanibacterium hippocampi TaxID=745714 RepID=UPI000A26F889|nr:NUDIX hydrolase [Oceanibacterium hippocampi]